MTVVFTRRRRMKKKDKEETQGYVCIEKRLCENTVERWPSQAKERGLRRKLS